MRPRNIEDSSPGYDKPLPATPLETYNRARGGRHQRFLNADEYAARLNWLAVYRDTSDPDEREHYFRLLQAQDKPATKPGEFEEKPCPMPDHIRKQLAELTRGSRGYDVPPQEFDR